VSNANVFGSADWVCEKVADGNLLFGYDGRANEP
jgi:hypothetical protein